MFRFECDYTEGAHKKILENLFNTNEEQTAGYGLDAHCEHAAVLIKKACEAPKAAVHFLVGGTQTNTTIIASCLRPYQGVISASTGHINGHETGAIEATGHKVLTIPSADGKITAAQIKEVFMTHWQDSSREHLVQPAMVYISHPTENGTTYNKQELQAISQICHELALPLFLDGARLGYALAAPNNELFLPDFAELCDIFYIGGTKVGALFGEAVVITKAELNRDFRYMLKQKGGMLAKGRLLGIQFETLFTDDLYMQISQHAVTLAQELKNCFLEKGYPLLYASETNQQFPIMPNDHLQKLSLKYSYSDWQKIDENHRAVRFCTSWATKEAIVQELIADIKNL